ncbi:MoaD/ThiS family protein [Chloroflexota bacterium]
MTNADRELMINTGSEANGKVAESGLGLIAPMGIKINIPSFFQRYTDELDTVEVNGATIGECISNLIERFPEMEKMLFYAPDDLDDGVAICLNREVLTAWDAPLKRRVVGGDEISLLVMAAGG